MRKFFAAIFVLAVLAASFAPVAGAMKEDHGFAKENCGPTSEDSTFFTFGVGSGQTVRHCH